MVPVTKALTAVAAVMAVLLGGIAAAHHGFAGRYDRSAPIYLEGTVVQAYFGYPHTEMVRDVDTDAGALALPASAAEFADGLTGWREALGAQPEIEFPPTSRFFDLEGRLWPGDRVAVIALRNCERPHQLRGQWIALPDGTTVVRAGRVQDEVDGC